MSKQHCATINWLVTVGLPHFHDQLQLGGNGRLLPAIWHLNSVALR